MPTVQFPLFHKTQRSAVARVQPSLLLSGGSDLQSSHPRAKQPYT